VPVNREAQKEWNAHGFRREWASDKQKTQQYIWELYRRVLRT
jgi:hypothetical protein